MQAIICAGGTISGREWLWVPLGWFVLIAYPLWGIKNLIKKVVNKLESIETGDRN